MRRSRLTVMSTAPLLGALAIGLLPATASADLAFNVGAVSDYRYRGISQSRLKPALQGGVDWSHPSGFYVGSWASTIKWIEDANPASSNELEIDVYGGYKGEIAKGLAYDVGVLSYLYPGHKASAGGFPSPNTTEIYGALTFGPATVKYSHSTTNLFGFPDSKNSKYLDISASFDVYGGWMLTPHVGRQLVENNGSATYTDASLTISKDFSGFVPSLAIVDARTGAYFGPGNKDLGKRRIVVGVKYNF